MRAGVDILVPAGQRPDGRTQPTPRQSTAKTPQTSDVQVRLVGNDMVGTAKPPLDHLRPRYIVQRSRPGPVVEPVVSQPTLNPVQSAPEVRTPRTATPVRPVKKRRWRKVLLLALAAPAMLAAGLMLQAAVVGEVLIGVYAIVALLRRIESRTTFMLALVALGCILVMLLVQPNPLLMKNFAIYTFLLMLVGTLSLTVETRY